MNTKTTEKDVISPKTKHFSQPPILGGCRTRNARSYEWYNKSEFGRLWGVGEKRGLLQWLLQQPLGFLKLVLNGELAGEAVGGEGFDDGGGCQLGVFVGTDQTVATLDKVLVIGST